MAQFKALNIPEDHPARDPLDNFYVATAAVGGGEVPGRRGRRSLAQPDFDRADSRDGGPPPVRVVCLGRVYRPDTIDATHSCMFQQMEGLMVGQGVTMAQLKTVIRMLFSAYLGHDVSIRFRPSFFPFTEPSVEVDIPWEGAGAWMEIGGAGMVDPNVLAAVGYDLRKSRLRLRWGSSGSA